MPAIEGGRIGTNPLASARTRPSCVASPKALSYQGGGRKGQGGTPLPALDLLLINPCDRKKIYQQLGDELTICVNYLEMQKIRFGEALRFDIHIPDSMRAAWCLPAFSLQLLAENAIKHNILTLERPLTITISCSDEIITVSNNLQKKEATHPGTGVGLANLQERYKILSGGGIVIDTDNDKFSVSIKALPYEGSHH